MNNVPKFVYKQTNPRITSAESVKVPNDSHYTTIICVSPGKFQPNISRISALRLEYIRNVKNG